MDPQQLFHGTPAIKADATGGPAMLNPHDMKNLIVHYNPPPGGTGVAVQLGQATPLQLQQAMGLAPPPAFTSPQPAPFGVEQGVTVNPQAPVVHHGMSVIDRPLQAFAATQPRPAAMLMPATASPLEQGPPVPESRVTFEIDHFGSHMVAYHAVLREDQWLILIYDLRYPGAMYEPPTAENALPMAVHVHGTDEVHLVRSLGISYNYEHRRFCILQIERSAPIQESPNGEASGY
jgi:hypothetical protein